MERIYCVYTDREVPCSETSPEHIIPLSLGGSGAFTIRVETGFNSTIGHSIDGQVANDPILKVLRAKRDARGHSNQPVEARWNRTVDQDGNPLQVTIHKDGIHVRDPKTGRILSDPEAGTRLLSSNFKIQPRAKIPFSAKVALGTGYFLYGDIFRKRADHQGLRALVRSLEKLDEETLKENKIRYFDSIFDPNFDRNDPNHNVAELMLRAFDCSAVIVSYASGALLFFIGILGEWFSTIVVPADDKAFPDTGDFDLGHALVIEPEGLARLSFREAVKQFGEFLNNERNQPKSADGESESY